MSSVAVVQYPPPVSHMVEVISQSSLGITPSRTMKMTFAFAVGFVDQNIHLLLMVFLNAHMRVFSKHPLLGITFIRRTYVVVLIFLGQCPPLGQIAKCCIV